MQPRLTTVTSIDFRTTKIPRSTIQRNALELETLEKQSTKNLTFGTSPDEKFQSLCDDGSMD